MGCLGLPRACLAPRRGRARRRRRPTCPQVQRPPPPQDPAHPKEPGKKGTTQRRMIIAFCVSFSSLFSVTRGETISVQGRRPQVTFVTRGARRSLTQTKRFPPFATLWREGPPNRQAPFGPGGSRREPAPDPQGGEGGKENWRPLWPPLRVGQGLGQNGHKAKEKEENQKGEEGTGQGG